MKYKKYKTEILPFKKGINFSNKSIKGKTNVADKIEKKIEVGAAINLNKNANKGQSKNAKIIKRIEKLDKKMVIMINQAKSHSTRISPI